MLVIIQYTSIYKREGFKMEIGCFGENGSVHKGRGLLERENELTT